MHPLQSEVLSQLAGPRVRACVRITSYRARFLSSTTTPTATGTTAREGLLIGYVRPYISRYVTEGASSLRKWRHSPRIDHDVLCGNA